MDILFCITALVACMVACDQTSGSPPQKVNVVSALKFDPWHTREDMADPRQAVAVVTRDEVSALGLPYELAKGEGDELAIEYKEFMRSIRITYRTHSGDMYRLIQNGLGPEHQPAPENRLEPFATYRGVALYGRDKSEGMAPWSAIWWDGRNLGEVELASETIPISDLIKIAKEVIDNSEPE